MLSGRQRTLTKAQRGRIIQHVIVDGWSCGEAAATFDIEERLVAAWVADYRRHGMASLHRATKETVAAELVQMRLSQPVKSLMRRSIGAVRRMLMREHAAAPPSPLRRMPDERLEAGSPSGFAKARRHGPSQTAGPPPTIG